MQLHKPDVVEAAAAILDNYGIADLTMRRLARELDVSAGALYWHFANKQELLGAVADRILQTAVRDVTERDWPTAIRQLARALREALLSHTDGAELVSASFAAGQSTAVLEILARLAAAARESGADPVRAALTARTIVHYVLGFTGDEQSRLQWDAAGAVLPAEQSVLNPATDPGAAFEFGLALLIDGLSVQARAQTS